MTAPTDASRRLRRLVRTYLLTPLSRLLARTVFRGRVALSWHLERNWGDALNPLFVEMISGRKVYHTDDPAIPRFIAIGSILHTADSNTEVWGSGFIKPDSAFVAPPKRVHAVRGPRTRARLLQLGVDCPEVYGDPALLLPRFWNPDAEVKFEIGVIPHMVDAHLPWVTALGRHESVRVIDIRGDLLGFVREVKSCRVILSSSLHGLICADAYGVPSRWIKLSDGLVGGQYKFDDYYLGIGQSPRPALEVHENTDVFALARQAERVVIRADLEALLLSCPFLSPALRKTVVDSRTASTRRPAEGPRA